MGATDNDRERQRLNDLSGKEWIRFTRSWFVCNPPRRKASEVEHPAKFPEALADAFIRFFTRAGETVLDPFSGVGSTVAAACAAGRTGVGIEINPEFLALSRTRPDMPNEAVLLQGDARTASDLLCERGLGPVHLILTSPPYWNMLGQSRGGVVSVHKKRGARGLRQVYSDDPNDLGNIEDYDAFITALTNIFTRLGAVLAPRRYLVVVIQNVRAPNGIVQPLAWDLARSLSEVFDFKGERIWAQDNKPLGIWGYPTEFVTNVHHHYCLVFKSNPRRLDRREPTGGETGT